MGIIGTVVSAIVGWAFILIAVGSGVAGLIGLIGEKVLELRDERRKRKSQG